MDIEIKKSLTFKTSDQKFSYLLIPKSLENVNVTELEEFIKKFFDTFNITPSNIPLSEAISPVSPESQKEIKPARKKRNTVIDIWNNVKAYLEDEFDANEYWNALVKAGYTHKESTKDAIPYQHLIKLAKLNKVERIPDSVPVRWRKVYFKTSEEGVNDAIKALQEGKKVEWGAGRELLRR